MRNDDNDAQQEVWRPTWVKPVAALLGLASAASVIVVGISGALVILAICQVLTSALSGTFHLYDLVLAIGVTAYFASFSLYFSGIHRNVCAVIVPLFSLALVALSVLTYSGQLAGIGLIFIIVILVSHIAALTTKNLGKMTGHLRSRTRWFRLHLNNQQCPYCLYNLRNLPEPRCPECGETW